MNDPERWIDGASGNAEILRLLKASKNAGPTLAEKAALGARLGVASGGVWLTPVIKAILASGGIMAGVLTFQALAPKDASPLVDSKAPSSVVPDEGFADKAESSERAIAVNPTAEIQRSESVTEIDRDAKQPQGVSGTSTKPTLKASSAVPPLIPSEARLLSQARHALESNPAGALSLISSHEKNYPNGVLTQEREVLKVKALQNLGQNQEAAATEKKFRVEHPESIHHVGPTPALK